MNIRDEIFNYAKEKFGSEPEFLWQKYPDYAVLRSKKNKKWYALIASVPMEKLGFESSKNMDILNVKCDPIMISSLVDNKRYFRAYHMNKEHWITLILNGEIPIQEKIKNIKKVVLEGKKHELDINGFLDIVKKYSQIENLTVDILNEFIDKIIVHHRETVNGMTTQKIEIFYKMIGNIEVPKISRK